MIQDTNPYLQDNLEDRSVIFHPQQGEVLNIKGGTVTFKVTSSISKDQLGIYEISLEPGVVGAQLHYHRFMEETFIVNRGCLSVSHGIKQTQAQPGSVIYIPDLLLTGLRIIQRSGSSLLWFSTRRKAVKVSFTGWSAF